MRWNLNLLQAMAAQALSEFSMRMRVPHMPCMCVSHLCFASPHHRATHLMAFWSSLGVMPAARGSEARYTDKKCPTARTTSSFSTTT